MKCKTSIIAIAIVTLFAAQGYSQSPYPGAPQGPPQGYLPQQGPPQGFMPQQGPPRGFIPPQGPPQGYLPQQGPPRGFIPPQGPPQGYLPQQGPPQGFIPPQGPPQGYMPQGPPRGFMPQQGPPRGFMPQQGPPQGYMPQGPPMMQPGAYGAPVAPYGVHPVAFQTPMAPHSITQDTSVTTDDSYNGESCDTCGAAAGSCGHCNGGSRFFGSVEYLLWWRHGQKAPPLATTSPAGTARAAIGVLPNAQILFGNQRYDDGAQSGVRLTAGIWTDDLHEFGIGGRYYIIGRDNVNYNALSNGTPSLARPFTNVTNPNNIVQAADLVAFTDPAFAGAVMSDGSINASLSNDIWGTEFFGTVLLDRGEGYRVDMLSGYQYTRIADGLNVSSLLTVQNSNFQNLVAVSTTIARNDVFDTRNQFNGGFLGLSGEIKEGPFSVRLLGKVAVGNMNERVRISGSSTTQVPGGASNTVAEGLLARASNIGSYTRNRTAFVPEVGITLGYAVNNCLKFTMGSTFIYWNDITRAGDAVDLNVDLSAAPNTQPAFTFRGTDFWTVGLNFGMEAQF